MRLPRALKTIGFIITLLFATLACRAAASLVLPDTPVPSRAEITPSPLIVESPDNTPTLRPTPQPITCSDDTCLNTCVERIEETIKPENVDSVGGQYAGKDTNLNLVVYKIKDGKLGDPAILFVPKEFKPLQENLNNQTLVWDYASALLPSDQLKWISEFDIFTDGPNETLAWVNNRDIFDRSHWQLGVDIADSENPVDLTYTLVHEFGHLITLNPDQIPETDYYSTWFQNPATCAQFNMPEGCTNPDSYLNLFYQQFWFPIFDAWIENVDQAASTSEDDQRQNVKEFYLDHADQFVREYAATNIREDIAESFMHFVLEPNPEGDSIADQKIQFFYEFPELMALRKQMIQNICSYTQQ